MLTCVDHQALENALTPEASHQDAWAIRLPTMLSAQTSQVVLRAPVKMESAKLLLSVEMVLCKMGRSVSVRGGLSAVSAQSVKSPKDGNVHLMVCTRIVAILMDFSRLRILPVKWRMAKLGIVMLEFVLHLRVQSISVKEVQQEKSKHFC